MSAVCMLLLHSLAVIIILFDIIRLCNPFAYYYYFGNVNNNNNWRPFFLPSSKTTKTLNIYWHFEYVIAKIKFNYNITRVFSKTYIIIFCVCLRRQHGIMTILLLDQAKNDFPLKAYRKVKSPPFYKKKYNTYKFII